MKHSRPEIDVQGIRDGNHDAISRMVECWDGPLYRLAFRILGSSTNAEEARQAVFLNIIEKPERLPDAARFSAWIRRCVINEAISIGRRTQRNQAVLSRLQIETDRTMPGSDDRVLQAEEHELLRQHLLSLHEDERVILSLRFDEGLTIREIGEILEKPHTTIQFQLNRAIQQLRADLSPVWEQNNA